MSRQTVLTLLNIYNQFDPFVPIVQVEGQRSNFEEIHIEILNCLHAFPRK
jgi:hypothetical protein